MNFGGYRYSEPGLTQALDIIPAVVYRWSAPSLIHSITISGLSVADQPQANKTYFNRTVLVDVEFPTAVKVRAALADVPYVDMPYIISDEAKTGHVANVVLPPGAEGGYTLFIKTLNEDDTQGSYMFSIPFQVEVAPTGRDSYKLLRLRKYSKNGHIARWNGASSL